MKKIFASLLISLSLFLPFAYSTNAASQPIRDDHYDYDDDGSHYCYNCCFYPGTHIKKPCTEKVRPVYEKDCYYLGTRILRKPCTPIGYERY